MNRFCKAMPALILYMLLMTAALCAADAAGGDEVFPADDPLIRYIGRHVEVSHGIGFAWAMSGFEFAFEGPKLTLELRAPSDISNTYNVFLDGKLISAKWAKGSWNIENTPIFPGEYDEKQVTLNDGPHTIKFLKSSTGVAKAVLKNVILAPGKKLLPMPTPPSGLRLEVIGDSHTEGLGNDIGAFFAYPGILARELGADLSLVAWASRGVSRNGGNAATETTILPEMFNLAIPFMGNKSQERAEWDHSRWKPQIVIINGGQADYQDKANLPDDFAAKYTAFIKQIQQVYPGVKILCLAHPVSKLPETIQAIVDDMQNQDVRFLDYGADQSNKLPFFYHGGQPHGGGHEIIATKIKEAIADWIEAIPYTAPPRPLKAAYDGVTFKKEEPGFSASPGESITISPLENDTPADAKITSVNLGVRAAKYAKISTDGTTITITVLPEATGSISFAYTISNGVSQDVGSGLIGVPLPKQN